MPDPIYNSREGLPLGLDSQEINGHDYVVISQDLPNEVTRTISRPDSNGDRKDFQIRKSGEPIEGSIELERDTVDTPIPEIGAEFSRPSVRGGTPWTWVVLEPKENPSRDAFDTFSLKLLRKEP